MPESVAALGARGIATAEKAAKTQADIVDQQGKSKRNFRLLAVSVALDIALSAATITLAVNQVHVSDHLHSSQVAACGIGNSFRAGQVQLWDHVIAISAAPPRETAARRAARLRRLADFRAYIARQFRPVNCTALYGK